MALGKALQAHPPSPADTVALDSLDHVFRAGGGEAACGRQQGGYELFVQPEGAGHDAPHRENKRSTSR